MKRRGFTLIEMLVVVGMIAVVIMTVTSIFINSYQSSRKVNLNSLVEENGQFVIREIRENILSADNRKIYCPTPAGVGTSVSFANREDDNVTSLVCVENDRIASISAELGEVRLTNTSVKVSGCGSFVKSCNSSQVNPIVEFAFNVYSGVPDPGSKNYSIRSFNHKVVVRD